ncbi:endonuclease/exonuclease/phosphatase family protein [Nocardioides caeni]|uniref:Endonuclease/exonuclease/phosphatase domain-containing protein n=1 Tax=Nocardioides caeni TaxID=574700 RepID=A0A4S8NF10_9ACTN|nr:endonuclease/exonuclease/phosphatase family protein [Nocardioides caeni]THV14651.1 hypothetical protein E9934_08295 [Nocardioides caeni]
MKHLLRLASLASLGALLLALLAVPIAAPGPSSALARVAPPPKVTGVTPVGQEWVAAKLQVRWRAIPGASYQVRWGRTTAALARARVHPSPRASATSPALSTRCEPWRVQVRAVRSGRVGPWSSARQVRFTNRAPGVPALRHSATVQTSETAARVTWGRTPYVARYRLDWSAAPNGYWKGFEHNHTPWQGPASTGVSIQLPAAATAGDRFLHPAYGNPVYGQLNYDNGCTRTYRKSGWFGFFPQSRVPDAGDAVAFGTYNTELPSRLGAVPAKIANLAENIASQDLDVVVLQEANDDRAQSLLARLDARGQTDWTSHGVGSQQVMWRTSQWELVEGTALGMANDGNPATPLPTPGVRLTPAAGVADPQRQDIFVVSVHLEDTPGGTVAQRKRNANKAAGILLDQIAAAGTAGLPVLAGGDFKGSFSDGSAGSGSCDESNGCVGEGQPTFVRAGFWDSRTAPVKDGLAFGTVNKHVANPPRNSTGVGNRTDFLLAKGAGGFTLHRNVVRTFGDASDSHQSDHNLVVAHVVIPRVS